MISQTLINITNTSNFAKIGCIILSLFAPFSTTIYFLVLLVAMDAFTALWWKAHASVKNTKGFRNKFFKILNVFECIKFLRTLEKLLFYIITIFVLYYFDTLVLHIIPLNFNGLSSFSLASIATLLISISELTSILKNISRITSIPILSKLTSILTSSNKSLLKKN